MISRVGQTRRAEYLLDAVRRDEILGIVVTQNFCRIADADGTRNVSLGIHVGGSYVPNNGISRDSIGDIVAVDDDGGRGTAACAHRNNSGMRIKRFMTNPPFPC